MSARLWLALGNIVTVHRSSISPTRLSHQRMLSQEMLGSSKPLVPATSETGQPFFCDNTLGALEGVLLLALGLLWPKLSLRAIASRVAFWCLLYSAFAILGAYTIAAAWGVGNETIVLAGELPHGLHHGSAFQETLIKILSYSSAPTGIIAFALILWGLRKSGYSDEPALNPIEA